MPPEPLVRAGGVRASGVRGEVQALRAIAVAMVVTYHLQPSALPGGYVGVDVFFVISGFLISRHLLREAERTGRVDLVAFWAGRVRRILPAALVAVVAVVATATALLPRTAAAEVGRTAWWAAASAANWLFASRAVDYLAQSADASPFEHFWSLGVEEQFYVAWPLLVLAAAAVAVRRRRSVGRSATVPFAIVLAASFAVGAWWTATAPQSAYFATPTRVWELAAGGLLAALLGDRRARPALALGAQVAGLVAIASGALLLDAGTPMPGVAALVPVLGAVAVVGAGDAPGLRRLWALRPVRLLGDTSYSLYLWHWPVIVFARHLAGGPLDVLGVLGVLGASLVLTAASYRLVEQPLRRVRIRRPGRVVAAGALAVAVVAGIAAVPVVRDATATAAEASAAVAVERMSAGPALGYPNLDAAADRTWARPQHVVVPAPAALADDLGLARCASGAGATTSVVCILGDRASTTTIALVGDSHLRQWGDALDRIGRQRHWRIVTLLHNSCPFNLVPRPLEVAGISHCTAAVRAALPVLRAQHVRMVLTSAFRGSYPASGLGRAAAGYAAMWRSLQQEGMPVVVLGDTPTPSAHPLTADCVVSRDPATCGTTRAQALAVRDPLETAAREVDGVPFVDPVDAFCGTRWCPGVIGNVAVWVDDNHAGRTYLRTATPWLQRRLVPLIEHALTEG